MNKRLFRSNGRCTRLALSFFLLSILAFTSQERPAPSDLTDSEKRGKELYMTGISPSGLAITAYLGEDQLEMPGEALTCGSCHGHDGTGRPESGIIPYNVTWKYLTKSYGHVHESGLQHGPFAEESLKHYMRTGVYPGGKKGDPSMPYYEISDRDLDDLVAYLKRLGADRDPGISAEWIKVGTLVPSSGPLAEIGRVIREVLEAYFGEVNGNGGIYGRKIELVVHEMDPQSDLETLKTWVDEEQPLALVSPFTPNLDVAVQSALSGESIPLLGPFTLFPIESYSLNRNVYYLYSGLSDQVRALVEFSGSELQLEKARVGLVYPDNASLTDVIEALEKSCQKKGWTVVWNEPFSPGSLDPSSLVDQLRSERADIVISLGVERDLRLFLEAAAGRNWAPYVLAPGVLSGSLVFDAPQAFDRRFCLAYPTLPGDRKPWAVREISRLVQVSPKDRSHTQAVISAYSAAAILVEGLRGAGRDLGRRELTAALEGFYQFETGLTPPITFTQNRRIGAKGAYIVRFDLEGRNRRDFLDSAEWVEVE